MGFWGKFGEKLGEGTGNGVNRASKSIWDILCEIIQSLKPDMNIGPNETFIQKNNFRIASYLIIFGVFTLGTCSWNPPSKSPPKAPPGTVVQNTNMVTVIGNLMIGQIPKMPEEKYFEPTRKENTEFFFFIGEQKYIMYRITSTGKPPQVNIPVDTSVCVLVPKGEKVLLATTIPPRYVVNMEQEISVRIMYKNLPSFFDKALLPFIGREEIINYTTSWKWLRENWSRIETKESGLLVRTKKNGLVCF